MHYIRALVSLVKNIVEQRTLLWQMTKRDFRQRYIGSYLGVVWAFIQPVVTVLVFWFVFQVGFKSQPVHNFPFILWLVAGMFPWFFISDSLMGATSAIIESSFLVQKVVFRVELLPMVKLLSALLVHIFFLAVLLVMYALYGYAPTIHALEVVYYAFAMFCLCLGISWLTSALTVFLRDVGQVVGIILQLGFWGTPIFWSLDLIPAEYHFFIKLNPAYYIIEGYRDTFIHHVWFWDHPNLTVYYWVVTVMLMFIGAVVFKRMRPHFADML